MIKIYNTLSKKIEDFLPICENKAGIYSCGPTVYNYAHIGNLRAYVFADLLKRYLKYRGFLVKHIMNITDVDDKTIKASRLAKKTLKEYTDFYAEAFLKDLSDLNIEIPDAMPRATEYIEEMVKLIKRLIGKKYAYKSGDSVYFDISKFKNYGKLAQIKGKSLRENADDRLNESDEYEKENINDFVLWKGWKKEDGEVFWETELGKGRPGWHIECSVMSVRYLGQPFDIHTGGVDLVFPHHTNEMAQSEAAEGKKLAKYWMHNAHLVVLNQKMSKSLNNFYTLQDIKDKNFHPLLLRIILLKTHYRQVLNFSFEEFKDAKAIAEKFLDFLLDLELIMSKKIKKDKIVSISADIKEARNNFQEALDYDLNISAAFAAVFDFVGKINRNLKNIGFTQASEIKRFILEVDSVFGFMEKINQEHTSRVKEILSDKEIKNIIEERVRLRFQKKYDKADILRERLLSKNITINDLSDGSYTIRALDVL